ncbi:MAG TPA: hypothetical protein VM577_00645 [Anaerovoracaceae bacterium]|nr:hypothetical protein [Anaerovoracaceae bacterium]
MNGRFQFDWVIQILSKDEQGLQIELAELGNGKHMIVATDTAQPVSKDVYRQAGFGPFVFDEGTTIDKEIKVLKEALLKRRNTGS